MNVKLIGKHEKDSRACRDGLALTLDEMMAAGQVHLLCGLRPDGLHQHQAAAGALSRPGL